MFSHLSWAFTAGHHTNRVEGLSPLPQLANKPLRASKSPPGPQASLIPFRNF